MLLATHVIHWIDFKLIPSNGGEMSSIFGERLDIIGSRRNRPEIATGVWYANATIRTDYKHDFRSIYVTRYRRKRHETRLGRRARARPFSSVTVRARSRSRCAGTTKNVDRGRCAIRFSMGVRNQTRRTVWKCHGPRRDRIGRHVVYTFRRNSSESFYNRTGYAPVENIITQKFRTPYNTIKSRTQQRRYRNCTLGRARSEVNRREQWI